MESKPDPPEPLDEVETLQKVGKLGEQEGIIETKEQLQKYYKERDRVSKQNKPKKPAQYQLAGEMLAAALYNYQNLFHKSSHTIFGLRIVGYVFAFASFDYRTSSIFIFWSERKGEKKGQK